MKLICPWTASRRSRRVKRHQPPVRADSRAVLAAVPACSTTGHLVVPGGGGFTLADQARMSPDGNLSTTPALASLITLDVEQVLCDALDR